MITFSADLIGFSYEGATVGKMCVEERAIERAGCHGVAPPVRGVMGDLLEQKEISEVVGGAEAGGLCGRSSSARRLAAGFAAGGAFRHGRCGVCRGCVRAL